MILRLAAVLLVVGAGPLASQEASEGVPEQIDIPEASSADAPPAEATADESTDPPDVETAPSPEARPTEVEATDPAPSDAPAGSGAAPSLDSVPLPPSRPEDNLTAEVPDAGPPALIPPGEDGPPADAAEPEPADDAAPAEQLDEDPDVLPMREALAETPEELSACLAALDEMGVIYERADPITEPDNPDCGIANPVSVSEIAPGVALEPPPVLRCETALAAARWARDVAVPLSAKLDRGDLVAIDQGTATLCRPRADGEMSEHAWGNALDVMGFRFSDGEPIPVEPRAGDGTLEEAFQRAARAGACLDFTTVLGPGSDADHADHLHLDIRARDGGFRICE
jgi:hypothetical protein